MHRDGKGRITRICNRGSPAGAAALAAGGRLYLAQQGSIYTVKSGETPRLLMDGFGLIFGLTLDDRGRLIVADWKNGRVFRIEGKRRKLLARGLEYPSGLALDRAGNLYIKESGRHTRKDATIRRLDEKGRLTLFATIPTRTRFKARSR